MFDFLWALSVDQIAILSAGLSAALGTGAVWLGLTERGPSARRARAILDRREDLRRQLRQPKRRDLTVAGVSIAKRVARRMRLLGGAKAKEAQVKLNRAGVRSRDAVPVYLFLKLAAPFAAGALAALLTYGLDLWALSPNGKLLVSAGAVLGGFAAPDLYLKNAADKRRQKMSRALPDALDLLVICTEAGLNLDSALVRVAREIGANSPDLAEELELTAVELGFLADRRQALQNLEARTGIPSVGALVSTLAQAEKYGTPLAQSLRVLAREMRDERLMKAEEKAARLPATLTVPMVVFILPSLFIVLIGPGILRTIDALTNL
ncbi:MAG: type II secretion system F family protein [Marivibrio sp.]|uniref:type II secretion system F family protein n=1 Tax=Marivibrio sp. TaxID=2039719 RepID=UPI0032ECFE77